MPLVAGEIGQGDCGTSYIDQLMPWLDSHGISYLAWAWNAASCGSPSLITDYSGTPTGFGAGFKNHLATSGPQSTSAPIVQAPGSCPTAAPTTQGPPPTTLPPTTNGPTSAPTLTVAKTAGWNDWWIEVSVSPNTNVQSVSASYVANGATQNVPLAPAPAEWNVPWYRNGASVQIPNPSAVIISVFMKDGSLQKYTVYNGNPPPSTGAPTTTTTATPTTTKAPTAAPTTTKPPTTKAPSTTTKAPTSAPTSAPTTTKAPTATTTKAPTSAPTSVGSRSVTKTSGWNSWFIQISVVPNTGINSVSAKYVANGQTYTIALKPVPWVQPQYWSENSLPAGIPNGAAVTITVNSSNGVETYLLYNTVKRIFSRNALHKRKN